MAKLDKRTDYRKKYPGLSDEIVKTLEQSDRKMEYQQYDLKAERFRIHYAEQTVICFRAGRIPMTGCWRKTDSLPSMERAWRMPRSKRY